MPPRPLATRLGEATGCPSAALATGVGMHDASTDAPNDFIPALSTPEAVARIYALTGARPRGRGEKRALVALRDALGVDIDIARTNSVLGAALAGRLGVEWRPESYTHKNHVTLAGLNALLRGAAKAYRREGLARVRSDATPTLAGPEWESFEPAISKIEAVTRIAALTGAPAESLGPGSKEHKSVLENLAQRLLVGRPLDRSSKTRLGRSIAQELNVAWPDTAYSTGETISLEGLNLILAGAERHLGLLGSRTSDLLLTPPAEGTALVNALRDGFGGAAWDGRACVTWMIENGVRGAFDNEWQGFYFEARARDILSRAFAPSHEPPRSRYGNTVFDYSLRFVWDLKAHTASRILPKTGDRRSGGRAAVLNDQEAVRRCVRDQGLGFLLLSGQAVMDEDGQFVEWHRALKTHHGVRIQPSNSGRSRVRKSSFAPMRLDALWLPNLPTLDAAVAAGIVKVFAQGRQAPVAPGIRGRERRPKYLLDTEQVAALRVGSVTWPAPDYESQPQDGFAKGHPARLW